MVWVERNKAKLGASQEIVQFALRVTTIVRPEDGARKVLHRHGASRLARRPREPVRRYERARPGELLHVDVKKLGRFHTPGKRVLGHGVGNQSRHAGWQYVHLAIDDHSRLAYVEVHPDESPASCCATLRRAVRWYAERGVLVERVLSDNGNGYRSHAWRDACLELHIQHKRTRPYRPQTNGKIERFHRTMADGWTFRQMFLSESARRKALPA